MVLTRRMLTAAVALASLVGSHSLTGQTALAAVDVTQAEAQLLEFLNADRVAFGLAPLQTDSRLMEVARWRSEDMVARNFFSHDLGGYTIARILRDRQVRFALAGENLVSNTFNDSTTVHLAHEELMRSDSHRENILRDEFDFVGVGVAIGPNRRTVYTQVFIQSPAERDGLPAAATPASATSVVTVQTPVPASTPVSTPTPVTAPGAVGSIVPPTLTLPPSSPGIVPAP